MEPITATIITGIAVNYFSQFTAPIVEGFFKTAFSKEPSLEKKLQNADTTSKIEAVLNESVGVIEANANVGEIEVFGGLIQAVKAVKFDHENGKVLLNGVEIDSSSIFTGSNSFNSTGQTLIEGGTVMRTEGTRISVGKGAHIRISGNASIRQS